MEGRHTQHPDDGGVNLQNLPTADVSVVSNINEAATQIASIDDSSVHGDDETPKPDDTTISTAYTIFSKTQVATIVAIASWAASFSGLSSNIYFPSISAIAKDLDVTSELVNLTVTLYLVFQGLSPSVWAPLSDTKGRRTVILITFAIYFGANIGLALTKSYAQLAVLRAVQSSASASSVAIGAAIVGNVVERRHRAGYMGIFNAASLLATAIGPVIGGAMAESLETLRKMVGNGSLPPPSWARAPTHRLWVFKDLEQKDSAHDARLSKHNGGGFSILHIFRPVLLLRNPSVAMSASYMALHYGVWQMTITASSTFYADRYGLDELQVGLTFLANGCGCVVGTLGAGYLLDWTYRRAQRANKSGTEDSLNIVSARLGLAWTFSLLECAAVLVFGWTIDRHISLGVPVAATFFIAVAVLASATGVQTFLVDSFPDQAASASATLNLMRCLMAAAGTSAILPMVNAMGVGWAFTLLTLLMLISNVVILYQVRRSRES